MYTWQIGRAAHCGGDYIDSHSIDISMRPAPAFLITRETTVHIWMKSIGFPQKATIAIGFAQIAILYCLT
jgi:hypothetical protein